MPEKKEDDTKPEIILAEIKSGFLELCSFLDSKIERSLDISNELAKLESWFSFMFSHSMYPEYNRLPDFHIMMKEIAVKLDFAESSKYKIQKERYIQICELINIKVNNKEYLITEFNELKSFYASLRDLPHSRRNTGFNGFLEEVRHKIEEINSCIDQTKKFLEKKKDLAVSSGAVRYDATTRNEFSAELVNHKCYFDRENETLYSHIMAILVDYSKNDTRTVIDKD